MGVSVSYYTIRPVTAGVRKAISNDADAIERDWWCESFLFYTDPRRKGQLVGDTKLFIPMYGPVKGRFINVNDSDDSFMAAYDLRFIIKTLERWSKEYGVDWLVEIAGAPVGQIVAGKSDRAVAAAPKDLLTLTKFEGVRLHRSEAEAIAQRLSKKYASRRSDEE